MTDLVATSADGRRVGTLEEAKEDLERKARVLLPDGHRDSELTWKPDPIQPLASFSLQIEPPSRD